MNRHSDADARLTACICETAQEDGVSSFAKKLSVRKLSVRILKRTGT